MPSSTSPAIGMRDRTAPIISKTHELNKVLAPLRAISGKVNDFFRAEYPEIMKIKAMILIIEGTNGMNVVSNTAAMMARMKAVRTRLTARASSAALSETGRNKVSPLPHASVAA